MDDRHGRHRRADADHRRRPDDGFRTRSLRRFARLVDDAIATLPAPVAAALENTEVVLREVPAVDDRTSDGGPALADYRPATAGGARGDQLLLYRRPLEGRAESRRDLGRLVRHVVLHEVAHRLGFDDDHIEDQGWE